MKSRCVCYTSTTLTQGKKTDKARRVCVTIRSVLVAWLSDKYYLVYQHTSLCESEKATHPLEGYTRRKHCSSIFSTCWII